MESGQINLNQENIALKFMKSRLLFPTGILELKIQKKLVCTLWLS